MEDGWSSWASESEACWMQLHLRGGGLIECNTYGSVTIKPPEEAVWEDCSSKSLKIYSRAGQVYIKARTLKLACQSEVF